MLAKQLCDLFSLQRLLERDLVPRAAAVVCIQARARRSMGESAAQDRETAA